MTRTITLTDEQFKRVISALDTHESALVREASQHPVIEARKAIHEELVVVMETRHHLLTA